MRKLLSGILAASMLFESSPVFADDRSSDIRKQILELTKELEELTKTEGDITYDVFESDNNCRHVVAKATNNYEYPISLLPYVVARDDSGNILFVSSLTKYDAVDSGETVIIQTNTNKDLSNTTYEFGAYIKPAVFTPANDKVKSIIAESGYKLRIGFELETESLNEDDVIGVSVYVLYFKDDEVIDVEYEMNVDLDDVVTIRYENEIPYDRYEVYLDVSCW